MELLDYWHLILRRKWIIFMSILACLTIGLGYIYSAKPIYEANVIMSVSEVNSDPASISDNRPMQPGLQEKLDLVNNMTKLIKTRPVLTRVVEDYNLKSPVKIQSVQNLSDAIKLKIVPDTSYIQLIYKDENPYQAANLANAIVSALSARRQELSQEQTAPVRNFIEVELSKQRDKLQEVENKLMKYKVNSGAFALEQETTSRLQSAAQLEALKMEMEAKLKGAYAQKRDLESKVNMESSRYSQFNSGWQQTLETVKSDITNLTAQLSQASTDLSRINSRLNAVPSQEIELVRLIREQKLASTLYDRLLQRFKELQINEGGNLTSVSIIEPAIVPGTPSSPQKMKLLLLFLAAGIGGGIILALLLEYLKPLPRTKEAVKELLPYNTLGTLPYQKKIDPLFMISNFNLELSEGIGMASANLKASPTLAYYKNNNNLCLMITSSIAGEGKSLVSANLAASFAQQGKKTLLLDLDLRKSKLHHIFNLKKQRNIEEYFHGTTSLKDIINAGPLSDLYIILSGSKKQNQIKMISNEKLQNMINSLKEIFDVVIIDTPPITLVSDALNIAYLVDSIILTVDMRNTPIAALNETREILEGKKLPVAGIIYNKMSPEYGHYGYYGYKPYYA